MGLFSEATKVAVFIIALLAPTWVTAQSTESSTVTAEERALLEAAFGKDPTASSPPPATAPSNPFTAALQSLNPDMSFILDVAAGYFTIEDPRQVGAHDPQRTGFTFQQLELSVGASVDPFFRFDANIVFAEFGVEVEEAYATSLRFPANLQIRTGQFLTRFGRINRTHPHAWSFMDQPLVNGKFFGAEGSRGLGIEVSWLTPLPWFAEVVASGHNPIGECCARSFAGGAPFTIRDPRDLLYTVALQQFFPFDEDWSLNWGLSAQLGPNATGNDNRTTLYGTDLYFRYRPVSSAVRASLVWQTELIYRQRQVPFDRLDDLGLYSQLVWNLDQQWELGLRYELVTGVADDPLDPEWSTARHRASTEMAFYPSHFTRVRGQVGVDLGRDLETAWAFLLNLEVLVGAHGAHHF